MRRNIDDDIDLSFLKTPKEKTKFQKYNDDAEKLLNQMERCKVWTDILQMIQNFTKLVNNNKNFPVVPTKQVFMRRMAQALDPQIPSGVHNQVLDLFNLLFERIGNDRLEADLWCFTPGLFPLIRSGSTEVRVKILDLIKDKLLTIIGSVQAVQKSFLISVVVGVEENTGGIKEKTITIMDSLKTINEKFFWETCWEILRANAVTRKPMMTYMNLKLDTPLATNQIPNQSLLFYSVMNVLSDDKQLVLRDMLDVLCTKLRLDSGVFSDEQYVQIVERMLLLLIKKDSALSRRVNFYLLGMDSKSQDTEKNTLVEFFNKYTAKVIEKAIGEMFAFLKKERTNDIVLICEELLGKQCIAEHIFKTVIGSMLELLQLSQEENRREDGEKVIEFLTNVECTILFDFVLEILKNKVVRYGVKRTFSFITTYKGDANKMEKFSDFCMQVLMTSLEKLDNLIKTNSPIKELSECFELIEFCLRERKSEIEEKCAEVLNITMSVDKVFTLFIKETVITDTIFPQPKQELFDRFCTIVRMLHAEITPFKKYQYSEQNDDVNEEEAEKMGITSVEMLMRKEVKQNEWIEQLKTLVLTHKLPVVQVKAAKCFYEIWKKEERVPLNMDEEEFVLKMFTILLDALDEENSSVLTDIVLILHTVGSAHKELTYKFLSSTLEDGDEDKLLKYTLFWKNSSVLGYDIQTSVFNRGLLLFLRQCVHKVQDPFYLEFLQTTLNANMMDRMIYPILIPMLTPVKKRSENVFGFVCDDQLCLMHLSILDTLFGFSNVKIVEALHQLNIPFYLNGLLKEINPTFEQMKEPSNMLDFVVYTLLIYLKGNKEVIGTEKVFPFQSQATDVLLTLFTVYNENQLVINESVEVQYTLLLSFAESITTSPKLQLHLMSLIKTVMKMCDANEPEKCITRFTLFLQTIISGICQERCVYRTHFVRLIEESLLFFPTKDFKTTSVLLIQAISNVISQTSCFSEHSLSLNEEIEPLVYLQKKLYEFSLQLFPYKSPLENAEQNQSQRTSAGQQIGNAMLFIPMLFVSVITDTVKGGKDKKMNSLEPHFLTATLKRTIVAFLDMFCAVGKVSNTLPLQSNIISFLEVLFVTFPLDFMGEYLLTFSSQAFPAQHSIVFRSFKPENLVSVLWSALILSQGDLYEDIQPQRIFEFIQFFIQTVLTPNEVFKMQMYIQSLIDTHVNDERLTITSVHTLKLFIETLQQNEPKAPLKLANGWPEIILNVVKSYMGIVQKWRVDGSAFKLRTRQKSTTSQITVSPTPTSGAASSVPSNPKVSQSSSEDHSSLSNVNLSDNTMTISADILDVVTSDIIPILVSVFDENLLSTYIDLGKQYEHVLAQPVADMGLNVACVNVLCELASRNQLIGRWNKLVINTFLSDDFFNKSPALLNKWKLPIFNALTSNAMKGLQDISNSIVNRQLFASKESEANSRAKNLKRIAFLIFSGENDVVDGLMDQNPNLLDSILDGLVDCIKQYPVSVIYVNGFLLLRVMFIKCSFTKLKKKIPTILNELITIFNMPFEKDAMTVLSGLQLYDMLQTIPECLTDSYSWIFFPPHSFEGITPSKKITPLIPILALNGNGSGDVKEPDTSYSGLKEKRELIFKEKKTLDAQEFQQLRTKLQFYTRDSFNMTSRSDQCDIASVLSDLLEAFAEK
ncbi:hypothetical protein EIN_065010 [Entamoeba invadens IP1]|uniref:DOP1 N-terminal domain-containing protein n=1 Tax=Entamoeba invadens IP1 TaxID=370355 RepID=A0A0A1TVA9_ENTIV|nr:hypothetical protein EIN_065010 [Entamoeba invadens IP1]ELP84256.1 hypothetical protein EIN_065010 [Entamoeba invadens IP1]|eukprot:XP_004183602.1 hypothetical protein EIN_065010 [Entamoeba invadens IP1]